MSTSKERESGRLREWLSEGFTRAEDIVYIGLGLLLVATATTLLITEILYFSRYLLTGALSQNIVLLLDRILLIIMLVEILYTVQVSFQQHTLHPEPFLVVGLIAVTRRILVLTAELSKFAQENESGFRNAMIELGLLTVLIVALVLCLRMLRQRDQPASVRS
ncbi:MAG: phosphate-starvation-inducible PsiE family protein [Candidatus Binatia bacterium]